MTECSSGGPDARGPRAAHRGVVVTICIATMLAMSVWFSASFIIADLQALWQVPSSLAGLITFALQIGFIVGAVLSSLLGLGERLSSRSIFFSAAFFASILNLMILFAGDFWGAVILRFLTGVALAGIYPIAVKDMLSWVNPRRQGIATGLLIGALTIGSAAPHLVVATVPTSWQVVVVVTSVLVAAAGVTYVIGVPRTKKSSRLSNVTFGGALAALRLKEVRLSIYAYFGHMWELYAMWACVGLFLSSRASQVPPEAVSLAAFAVIAVGAAGAVSAGALGDRFGKGRIAELSLWLSGGCAIATLFSGSFSFIALVCLCAMWGFWVIADSGLLSALLGSASPPQYLASIVALQLAGGYAISSITVLAIPILHDLFDWEAALPILAIGPAIAILALRRLRRPSRVGQTALFPSQT